MKVVFSQKTESLRYRFRAPVSSGWRCPLENHPKSRNPQGPDCCGGYSPRRVIFTTQTFGGWASNLRENQNVSLALRAKCILPTQTFRAREATFTTLTFRGGFSACMGSWQVGLKASDSGKRVLSVGRTCSMVYCKTFIEKGFRKSASKMLDGLL